MIKNRLIPLAVAIGLASICGPLMPGAQAGITVPAATASLQIAPHRNYLGGQALSWTGNVGVTGERTITMQRHLGREGDGWEDVEYFSDRTNAAGAFAFWYPAPAMRGITYRVVSDRHVTPGVELQALQQDLVLWVTGHDRDDPEDVGRAVADEPFGISVDTTPHLFRRADTIGLQPIRDRELTLQRRVDGATWRTIGTGAVDAEGMGYFTGVTAGEPGEVVYRVRQEDWTKGHNEIGWFPSFPTYVQIGRPGDGTVTGTGTGAGTAGGAVADPATATATEPVSPAETPADAGDDPEGAGVSPSAASRYHWSPSLYDFAWVKGESLTSPPWRGTRKRGWWLDSSTGGGRLSKDGGGLSLDSKRVNDVGPGDFGTTAGTLQGNPITFGRWETKLAVMADENNAEDYSIRFELVPDRQQGDACRTITVAEFTDHGDTIDFGVNAGQTQWTGRAAIGDVDDRPINFAVERARDHITWFVDSEPIGTVRDEKALSKVPMTMRVSMVGDGQAEMNRTRVMSDWQRGYALSRGEQVKSGAPLTQRALGDC